MSEKVKGFMEDAAGYLAVAVVSLLYIATAVFVPGATGKSLGTIIADGVASFLLGICINFNLNMQGVLRGERSDKMLATKKLHAQTVTDLAPFMHLLDGWCANQNEKAMRSARARILMQVGLRYEDCFDQNGVPKKLNLADVDDKTAELRAKAIKKATRLTLSQLSSAILTGEGGREEDPYDLGENVSQYLQHSNLRDALSKILVALVFGYFGVQLIDSFSYAELIWRALQVAILLAMGVAKLTRSYLFMVDTYRGNIVRKINYLQSFKNWAEIQPQEREEKEDGSHNAGQLQEQGSGLAGAKESAAEGNGADQPSKVVEIS